LTAAFTTSASDKRGRLLYAVAVEGEVVCDDAWVNVPDKVIECDYEAPEAAPTKNREIVTE